MVIVVVCVLSILRYSRFSTQTRAGSSDRGREDVVTFKSWRLRAITILEPNIQKNCQKIFKGDKQEAKRVLEESAKWINPVQDTDLLKLTENCLWVRNTFGDNLYTTKLEKSFPIAFTFTIYNSPQQVLRLLKALYRSVNTYCIHVDPKSDQTFIDIFGNIAKCLSNVHMASKLYKVTWGDNGVMKAQMQCLSDLVKVQKELPQERKWKYSINLCGKELPIITNHEIVVYLLKLNGSSDINVFELDKKAQEWRRLKGRKIPFNLPYYKSQSNIAVSFQFAKHLLTDRKALDLYKFFLNCRMPEEHYYATVYKLPNFPGGFNAELPKGLYVPVERAFWRFKNGKAQCHGRIVHNICIVNAADLNHVMTRSNYGTAGMFHNKYFMEDDHTVMDCVEEMIVEKNIEEHERDNG